MPAKVHLTAQQARQLAGLEQAKPSPQKQRLPRAPAERQTPDVPTGEVTHILVKSLYGRYNPAPVIGSLAWCEKLPCGLWNVQVYAGGGRMLLDMTERDFQNYFQEV